MTNEKKKSNQTRPFNAAQIKQAVCSNGHTPDPCDEFNQKCIECGGIIPDTESAEFWAEEMQARKEYRRAVNLAIDSEYYADEKEEQ